MKTILKTACHAMVGMAILSMMVACNNHLTPDTDTTQLWPAYQSVMEKYGYINKKGEWAINPTFNSASTFSCGYAQVTLNGKTYMINTKGEVQQTMSLDRIDDFYYNYAVCVSQDNYGLLNTDFGYAVFPLYAYLGRMSKEGLVAFKRDASDKEYGYIDAKGKQVIFPQFSGAETFRDGAAVIGQGGKYGLIDTNGKLVIMPIYDAMYSVGEGLVAFEENNRIGLFSTSGKTIMQSMYTYIGEYHDNGLAAYSLSDKLGYIDAAGKEKIPAQYDMAYAFSEGYAWVYQSRRWQLINTNGEMQTLLSEGDRPVSLCHNGLMLIVTSSGQYRYIKPTGEVVFSWNEGNTSFRSVEKGISKHFMLTSE